MTSDSRKRALPRAFGLAGLALLAPTALLWICVLVSLAGIEFTFPANCCCAMGGFGGLILALGLPVLGLASSVVSILSAKRNRMPIPAFGLIAAIASVVLIALAFAATLLP